MSYYISIDQTCDLFNLAAFQSSAESDLNSLSLMVFSAGQRCATGDRCAGEPVAENEIECISLHLFDCWTVRSERISLTLVVPHWESQVWFGDLMIHRSPW